MTAIIFDFKNGVPKNESDGTSFFLAKINEIIVFTIPLSLNSIIFYTERVQTLNTIIIFLIGLCAGSFLSVVVDRMPLGETIVRGRSRCPKCKKQINAYDNIPLVSYIHLGGKCRNCGKKVSKFYPFIELVMGFTFLAIYQLTSLCSDSVSMYCSWNSNLGVFALPFFFIFVTLLVGIFIIDYRHQIIPDELSLTLFVMSVFALIFAWPDKMYVNLLCGFGAASFLLILHLLTKGKGMGLGDVKLVVPLGIILGFPLTIIWMSLSFVIGAVVGIVLILLGKTKFGRHIAFGPFLIIAFLIALFGTIDLSYLMPI